jgi:hypothetical protein
MGIFDFLKKKLSEDEEDKKTEKISFTGLENFSKNIKEKAEKESRAFKEQILNRVKQLEEEFSEEIYILKKLDLSEKRVEEKIKLIVKENLGVYIYQLGKLLESLSLLDKHENPKELVKQIDELFINFEKKSRMSFEKATFIIGKELGNVRESTSRFFRDLKQIINENEDLMKDFELIETIEKNFAEITRQNHAISEIRTKTKEIEESIKNLIEEEKIIEKDIGFFQKSQEYKDILEQKKKLENLNQEIKKSISQLKSLIDFKSLARIYHSSEKKMKLINEYNQNIYNFHELFEMDNGAEILELIEDAKLINDKIREKISEITENKQELSDIKIGEDKTHELNEKLAKEKDKIKELEKEKENQEKIMQRIEEKTREIREFLKSEMKKFDIEVY